MRYRVRGDGGWQGPVGPEAGEWMALWTESELQLARARQVGDRVQIALFEAMARATLYRTLRGRGN